MHSVIADSGGGAWTFGSSILTFAFPMILFVVVAAALYVAYTKPELSPGHRNPAVRHPVSYTSVPGPMPAEDVAITKLAITKVEMATDEKATDEKATDEKATDEKAKPEGGE